MSTKKLGLNYPIDIEYYVPNSPPAPTKLIKKIALKVNAGDMVRWPVPTGKGNKNAGAGMWHDLNSFTERYSEDDRLRYEDIAIVIAQVFADQKKHWISYSTEHKDVHMLLVLTSHGCGWVEAKLLIKVKK